MPEAKSVLSAVWRKSMAVLATLSAFSWHLAGASCLEYGAVTLSGNVVRQTYPGPPDYESVTKGDEPRVIWILLLEPGVCVVDPSGRNPRVRYEREVQLVRRSDPYARYESLLGKEVVVHGELQHGGARYDKRLVIAVDEIAASRQPDTTSRDPYDRR